jgi:hypothetical protein
MQLHATEQDLHKLGAVSRFGSVYGLLHQVRKVGKVLVGDEYECVG